MRRLGLISLLLLATTVFAQSMITKVISLNYISAEKAMELMKPLMQADEKLSGTGQTLIAQVSPETLTQIRTVLHQVDVPPATFNISIYQGDPQLLSAQNNNSVVYSTQSPAEVLRSQSVRVMNGESALVSSSQQVPIVSAVGAGFFTGVAYQQHNIKNGLLVRPLLRGSSVQLSVRRVREQMNAAGGQQFDNQNIDTTMMVPLNKWVPLGSAEGAQSVDSSSTSYTAGRNFSQQSTLYVKVTLVRN